MNQVKQGRSRQRVGKKLLVAAAGVASISYVGAIQGCAGQGPSGESQPREMKSTQDGADGGAADDATDKALGLPAASIAKKPARPVGNLMPPVGVAIDGELDFRVPTPVGNLMVTPVDQLKVDVYSHEMLEKPVTGTP